MKKFLLSAIFVFALASCSTDDTATSWDNNAVTGNEVNLKTSSNNLPSCFGDLIASISLDLTNGINNPRFDFLANLKGSYIKGNRSVKYLLSVEMQALADCEDLAIPQGPIVKITNPTYYVLLNDTVKPSMSLQQGQMMTGCYRWRLVMDGYTIDGTNTQTCNIVSNWKDAPVY